MLLVPITLVLPVQTAGAACPLGDALFQEYTPVGVTGPPSSDPYTAGILEFDESDASGTVSGRSATTTGAPPRRPATADVQLETTGSWSTNAHADASWEAVVSGPDGVIPIHLHLIGEATASGQARAIAESTLYLDNGTGLRGDVLVSNLARADSFRPEAGYDNVVQTEITVTGGCAKLYFVAYASVESSGDSGGQAVADPELTLDPSIAGLYTITYSPNFFDPDAVPTDSADPGDTDVAVDSDDPAAVTADPDPEKGCGCVAAGSPGRVAVFGALALVLRRRRRG